jgi:hypothetical protein
MPQLIEVDWTGLPYDVFDAVQSFLVDHPDSYYLAPNLKWMCYLTREFGLIMLHHDFSGMDDEEISDYLVGALELLYE